MASLKKQRKRQERFQKRKWNSLTDKQRRRVRAQRKEKQRIFMKGIKEALGFDKFVIKPRYSPNEAENWAERTLREWRKEII
jgi:hypothetical protein